MKIYRDFNEKACTRVARLSGVKQCYDDVRYARLMYHYKPSQLYCLRSELFFLLGCLSSRTLRIIGIAVIESEQRKGWGKRLLKQAIQDAKARGGVNLITTLTESGADFYAKQGFDIVGTKGREYIMQLKI